MKDKGFVNIATSLLGILAIPFAFYLGYAKESFGGFDILLTVLAAMILIWFKAEAARDLISSFVEKQNLK